MGGRKDVPAYMSQDGWHDMRGEISVYQTVFVGTDGDDAMDMWVNVPTCGVKLVSTV
jgi:hypothetical protein